MDLDWSGAQYLQALYLCAKQDGRPQANIVFQQLGTFGRAKRKVDELQRVIAEARRTGGH